MPMAPAKKMPTPSVRERLSPEMEAELNEAMADAPLDDLLGCTTPVTAEQEQLEADSRQTGRVLALRRDDVFVELGGREQGIISIRQFETPPEVGASIEVVVQRMNPEDGLYELSIPHKAVSVEDWSDIREGMLVEAQVTAANSGGLECEVNHLRGFIPLSQMALYRIEDATQFVGQRLTCIVTEANPERRNLVLSRRAVLEREREESRQQLLQALQPGEVREGVVRKLMDFGAFVDLGGVDGLLHVSQLAWHRVKHPSDVLAEGQHIKVRVDRIDPDTGKISLAYRDLMESPWLQAAVKFPPNGVVQGKVTKLMEFGAFVELEPGVEGLVHISELSHKRIWRTSDVVKEGDQVEVLVLSVDSQSQRISLSMKALAPAPQPAKKDDEAPQPEGEAGAAAAPAKPKKIKPQGPLSGGLGRPTGGARFGLKW
jgi:small subunit ribosomal protein S1